MDHIASQESLVLVATPTGPALVVYLGILAIMFALVVKTFRRVENHPERDALKSMSMRQKWQAFKLAKSGERIDDPIERRLAERYLRYIALTPAPGWKFILLILGLAFIAALVQGGPWQQMAAKYLMFGVIFGLPGLLVLRLKRKYAETSRANGWDFSEGAGA